MYPSNPKFVQEAFQDATKNPYGYLLIDLKQETPELYRYRADIFNKNPTIYVPKKNTLKGRVKLTPLQKRRLSRHKNTLRKLAKRGDTWKEKRKIISQSGGFLLPLLAPILGTVLSTVLK
ncbi:hypothetical protein B566_EDAN018468 [Ephemera danica]|nr:hypothetical protein B566_EDAN018468 [Ephemera danica]